MDPNQQPQRPKQRTPFISDFVAAPRPDSLAAPKADSTAAPRPQAVSTPAATPMSQTPIASAAPAKPIAMPVTAVQPSLINAQPMTSVSPVRPAPEAGTISPSPATAAPRRSSFEPEKTPDVEPKITKVIKPHQGLRDVASIFGVLASALILAFCLITFVFQSYQVDGPSMQTTLQNNDHLIVWKVAKTFSNLTRHHYIPNRGDVIVFNEHTADSGSGDKQLIKRVIGLPGERVVVKNDQITVYNKEFPNGFSPDKTMPYGKVIVTTPGNVDITLGDDEIYVCGDNRTNSLDSRVFGPIQSKQIVGKLVLRVLPLNTVTKF